MNLLSFLPEVCKWFKNIDLFLIKKKKDARTVVGVPAAGVGSLTHPLGVSFAGLHHQIDRPVLSLPGTTGIG